MNKKICIYTLATLSLMACSSSDGDEQQGTPPAKRPLTVVVNETPFVDENGNALAPTRQGTRGSAVTTEALETFYMSYNDNPYKVEKTPSTREWNTTPSIWPVSDNDETITFYAYNAGTYNNDYGNSNISFSVNNNASSQTDLLVATQTTSYSDSQGQVSLTFGHACAAVDFKLRLPASLSEKNNTITITDITLKNVANEGDYYYNEGWKDIGGNGEYELNDAAMSLTTSPQALTCGTLFMIPQVLGDEAVLSFKYEEVEKTIWLKGAEWAEGTRYVMDIVIGKKTLGLE